MTHRPGPNRQFFTLALWLLAWFSLGTAVHAFATSSLILGLLGLIVSGLSIYLATTRKLIARIGEGTVTGARILFLAAIPAVVVVYEVRNLNFSRVQLLGETYVPGIILIVTAIGSILIAALMVIPLLAMLRVRAPEQKP